VLYAEFSDGSVYSHKRDARDILASRSVIIEALQRLDRPNDDRDFLQILAQKFEPIRADDFLDEVRSAQKSSGTGAAHRMVHGELANAEKHLAAMRSAAPLQKVLKEYEMSGVVIVVRPQSKKIRVYNEDIPGFLTPRVMDYEVRDQTTLSDLRFLDTIHATLLNDNEEVWVLENPVVINRP
jgi:Cu/Ag efflux protein CusF